MPTPFDPTEFAMLSDTGYFGVPDNKLEEIAEEMRGGKALFNAAWDCGIDPANLTSDDKRAIRELLEDEE